MPTKVRIALIGIAMLGGAVTTIAQLDGVRLPAPVVDTALAPKGTPIRKAVLAGGCFWGIQYLYQHTRGVTKALSGYAGGSATTANYDAIGGGTTGHAESVEISYDPARVTYGQLLHIFFSVGHDPTTVDRQGPDYGSQYRSAIFVVDDEQESIARAYIRQIDQTRAFGSPVVTQVTRLPAFYPAENYHQDYARLNPTDPYIVINDLPKVDNFKKLFPALYAGK